jgi:hypothetical protein
MSIAPSAIETAGYRWTNRRSRSTAASSPSRQSEKKAIGKATAASSAMAVSFAKSNFR